MNHKTLHLSDLVFLSNHHWFAVCSELLIEPPKYPAQSHRSNWILKNYIYINYISSLLDHLVCFDLMTGDHYYNIQIKQLSFFYMECFMECVNYEICRKNIIHNFFPNLHLHGQKKKLQLNVIFRLHQSALARKSNIGTGILTDVF